MLRLLHQLPSTDGAERVAPQLVGSAPPFVYAISRLRAIASSSDPVLIRGETGTGKTLVARALHEMGRRASAPFVAVHCSAVADARVETDLLGSDLVTHAEGGTLLLDEAEALTPRAQLALLRAIEEQLFHSDASRTAPRDVRFVAATRDDLGRLVQSGRFRADLYYRLCVFSVTLPPLRQRREDVLPLAAHFIGKHFRGPGELPRLSAQASEALLAQDWPGNVRELENSIVRALNQEKNGLIETRDLELPGENGIRESSHSEGIALSFREQKRRALETFERTYLVSLMREHHGNVSRAARTARKERRDLGKLLKRRGIDPRQFRR